MWGVYKSDIETILTTHNTYVMINMGPYTVKYNKTIFLSNLCTHSDTFFFKRSQYAISFMVYGEIHRYLDYYRKYDS